MNMKSIKEKSLEVFPEHCNAYTDARNKDKRIGFEAGANYVLDHLSMTISVSEDGYLYDNLKKMMKQLKSN